jgi:hypothetical protein
MRSKRVKSWAVGVAMTFSAGAIVFGDTNLPVEIPPLVILTNHSPIYLRDMSGVPGLPGGVTLDSPVETTNFVSVLNRGNVPDTQGAVGTNMLVALHNDNHHVQTWLGSSLVSTTLRQFWTNSGFQTAFDPRVVYEPYNHRWIATSVTDYYTTNSYLLIGVSVTSNPTNGWYQCKIKTDDTNEYWADYPTLGFNKDWIVVQVNMVKLATGNVSNSHVYVFNKTSLYSGVFSSPKVFTNDQANAAGGETPAMTYDNSLAAVYLVQDSAKNDLDRAEGGQGICEGRFRGSVSKVHPDIGSAGTGAGKRAGAGGERRAEGG